MSADTLDLVFMPLVAFDRDGNRIGMGKGYYDHTFSEKSKWSKMPLLLGIGTVSKKQPYTPSPKGYSDGCGCDRIGVHLLSKERRFGMLTRSGV